MITSLHFGCPWLTRRSSSKGKGAQLCGPVQAQTICSAKRSKNKNNFTLTWKMTIISKSMAILSILYWVKIEEQVGQCHWPTFLVCTHGPKVTAKNKQWQEHKSSRDILAIYGQLQIVFLDMCFKSVWQIKEQNPVWYKITISCCLFT